MKSPLGPYVLTAWSWWRWGQSIWAVYQWELVACLGGLVLIGISLRVTINRRWHHAPGASTSWGSSRWATVAEVRAHGWFRGDGLVLGRMNGRLLRAAPGLHAAIVAGTQSGKTLAFLVPSIVRMDRWSLVLNDPKRGELYQLTARHRRTIGPVYRFAPDSEQWPQAVRDAARINPYDLVRWQTVNEVGDLQQLVWQLTEPDGVESATSRFYRGWAREVLLAAGLWIAYDRTGAFRLSPGGMLAYLSCPPRAQLDEWSASPDATVRDIAGRIIGLTAREWPKVWDAALGFFTLWRDPLVAAWTEATDIPIDGLQGGTTPSTLYLQARADRLQGSHRVLFRWVWQVLLGQCLAREEGAGGWPQCNIFEEFHALGYLEPVNQYFNMSAGLGVSNVAVLQSLAQLEAYPSVLSNCKIRLLYAQFDPEHGRTLETLIGDVTVQDIHDRVAGHPLGLLWRSRGRMTSTHRRPLLTAAEWSELPNRVGVLRLPDGLKPVLVEKSWVNTDRRLRRLVGGS